jgi:nucleoside 2-deoxyribosyltransferase
VDDEIIAEIRRSRFLVADFTCEPEKVRGGVYFETGFAMGLNIPIIWTCKDTSMKERHFDTRQFPHIVWTNSENLYKQLKARIGALIGQGPKKRG